MAPRLAAVAGLAALAAQSSSWPLRRPQVLPGLRPSCTASLQQQKMRLRLPVAQFFGRTEYFTASRKRAGRAAQARCSEWSSNLGPPAAGNELIPGDKSP